MDEIAKSLVRKLTLEIENLTEEINDTEAIIKNAQNKLKIKIENKKDAIEFLKRGY
jgi:hypothetical protein